MRHHRIPERVPRLGILFFLVAAASEAADWPQWRGPGRDGRATAGLPAQLPEALRRLWSVEVGIGHSSPVVVGDRVYVFGRDGEHEVVRALDLAAGREIWVHSVPTAYTPDPAALTHGSGPKSTPVVSGTSLCVLGITGRLTCLDRESGAVRWQHDFRARFARTYPEYGAAMSPAVIDDRLVAHVGGIEAGSLSAFDLESGNELWSWAGDGPAYASPVRTRIAGVDQIVTLSREQIVSLATDSGRLLWKTPLVTDYAQNAVSPLVHGSTLILSGLDRGIFALDAQPDGNGRWLVRKKWHNDELPMYMSSPVLLDGLIFGFTHKRSGQLFCLDADTGTLHWTSDGRQGENASLILAGNRLLVLTSEAEVQVGRAAAEAWQPEARYTVSDSPTWAHPALLDTRLLVRDKTRLAAWSFE